MIAIVGGAVLLTTVVALVYVAYRRGWRWTGFVGPDDGSADGERRSKTLWDWLQLLIVPIALAAVGFALNAAQTTREQRREDQRTAQDRVLAERRAAADRDLARDRTREEALQTYLQEMSRLLLDQHLLHAGDSSAPRVLAHTLTLGVLRRLDGERKGVVIRFIDEAGLISEISPRAPRISLEGADLRGAVLDGARLQQPVFERADLRNASFRDTALYSPNFYGSDLRGTDFSNSLQDGPVYDDTCLSNAKFNRATLNDPSLSLAYGHDVDFRDARMHRPTGPRSLLHARKPGAEPTPTSNDEERECARRRSVTSVG